MLGRVYSIVPDPKGFSRLYLQCRSPYSTTFKKFTVWSVGRLEKVVGSTMETGTMVKFVEDKESQYPTLKSIRLASLDTCFTCQGFYETGDAQRMDCGDCSNVEPKEQLDGEVKLVNIKEKKYTFSMGITLTFANEDESCTYSTCVFDKSPLYHGVKELKKDESYHVKGWITSEVDRGIDGVKAFIELDDVPEE